MSMAEDRILPLIAEIITEFHWKKHWIQSFFTSWLSLLLSTALAIWNHHNPSNCIPPSVTYCRRGVSHWSKQLTKAPSDLCRISRWLTLNLTLTHTELSVSLFMQHVVFTCINRHPWHLIRWNQGSPQPVFSPNTSKSLTSSTQLRTYFKTLFIQSISSLRLCNNVYYLSNITYCSTAGCFSFFKSRRTIPQLHWLWWNSRLILSMVFR